MKEKINKYTPEQAAYIVSVDELSQSNEVILGKPLSRLDKELVDRIAKEIHFFDGYQCKGVP